MLRVENQGECITNRRAGSRNSPSVTTRLAHPFHRGSLCLLVWQSAGAQREQYDLLFWDTPQVVFILQMTGSLQKSHSCESSVETQTACGTKACTQLQVSASTSRWARVSSTSLRPADRTWDLEEQLLEARKNTEDQLK